MDDQMAFADCLDAFGPDPDRWPQERRGDFHALLSHSAEARRCLAEARALDTLMSRGTRLDSPTGLTRLEDLIVAAAVSERASGIGSAAGNVVPMRAPVRQPAHPRSAPVETAPRTGDRIARRSAWRSATLLAASLFAGVIIGISEPGQSTMNGFVSAVSSSSWEGNDIATAIQSESFDSLEETL
jgi:hypothetical protein